MTELVLFALRVLGWACLHLAWQGVLVGLVTWASLQLLRDASPVIRERLAGSALAWLATLFVYDAFRALGYAFEVGPERLAPARWLIASPLDAATPWLGALWLLGAAVLFLRLSTGILAAQRLRASARPLSALLFESNMVQAPALVGFLHPVILVPAGSTTPKAVLAHETAHLERGDAWGNLAARLARAALWFHPAAWMLVGQLDVERELACDDRAAQAHGAPALARALAALERSRAHVPGLAANGAPLLLRVRRLVEPRPPARGAWTWATAAALCLLAFGLVETPTAGGPCLPQVIALFAPHSQPHVEGPWDDKRLVLRDVHRTH